MPRGPRETITACWVNVGVGYGGRQEIIDAVASYLSDSFSRGETPEEIVQKLTRHTLDKYLYTYDCPDPDLIIYERRSAVVRVHAQAKRVQRVPLLRCVLAIFPEDRLLAGYPKRPTARPQVREVARASGDRRGVSRRTRHTAGAGGVLPSTVEVPGQTVLPSQAW